MGRGDIFSMLRVVSDLKVERQDRRGDLSYTVSLPGRGRVE